MKQLDSFKLLVRQKMELAETGEYDTEMLADEIRDEAQSLITAAVTY